MNPGNPEDSSPASQSEAWNVLAGAVVCQLAGVVLFALAVWVMVFLNWLGVLSAKGMMVATLFLLAGPLVYLLSFLVLLAAIATALQKRAYLAFAVSLLVTLAAFVGGSFVWQHFQQHGMPGLIAVFGGSGLKF